MKLVINTCFGGFGLSEKAMRRYFALKGWPIYIERHGSWSATYWKVPPEEGPIKPEPWETAPLEDRQRYNAEYVKKSVYAGDIPRDDPDLVRVVEELGEAANGPYASLSIVEIPDGAEWQIEEYDGNEHVAEKHRTWE
jgi:hypothetical protein